MTEEDSSLASLREAQKDFRKYIENEKNPVKQNKLKEFLPYVDKTLDIHELKWLQTKAIQTADAAHAHLERQKEERALKQRQETTWKKMLILLWCVYVVVSAIVIWKGLGTVYVYKASNGLEMISATFKGATVVLEDTPLEFRGSRLGFIYEPFVRGVSIFVGAIILSLLSIVKTTLKEAFV